MRTASLLIGPIPSDKDRGGSGRCRLVQVRADVLARAHVRRDQQPDVADANLDAGRHRGPVDAGDGQVLARAAGRDRMPFPLQRADHVQLVEDHGPIQPAVGAQVALPVALEPVRGDERFEGALFRHAAPRGVDRFEPAYTVAHSGILCSASLSRERCGRPRS